MLNNEIDQKEYKNMREDASFWGKALGVLTPALVIGVCFGLSLLSGGIGPAIAQGLMVFLLGAMLTMVTTVSRLALSSMLGNYMDSLFGEAPKKGAPFKALLRSYAYGLTMISPLGLVVKPAKVLFYDLPRTIVALTKKETALSEEKTKKIKMFFYDEEKETREAESAAPEETAVPRKRLQIETPVVTHAATATAPKLRSLHSNQHEP